VSSLLLILLTGCGVDGGLAPDRLAEPTSPAPLGLLLSEHRDRLDGVVLGTVSAIQYLPPEGDAPFARTLVTWDVESEWLSDGPESLTLQLGGGRLLSGDIQHLSEVPLFNPGEQDLLLLVDEATSPWCPLLGCEAGVVRIIEGRAYTAGGHALSLDASGVLRAGDVAAHPALHTFDVDGSTLTLRRPEASDRTPPAMTTADLTAFLHSSFRGDR